jgi:signal transduction histidine kinase/DNA-binding response OmpR family regulator
MPTDPLSILIVEDDAVLRLNIRLWLHHVGCEVVECANWNEANAAMVHGRFDLALVDLRCSEDDVSPTLEGGLICLGRFRKAHPTLSILAVTGDPDEAHSGVVAYEHGASHILHKPLQKNELVNTVRLFAVLNRYLAEIDGIDDSKVKELFPSAFLPILSHYQLTNQKIVERLIQTRFAADQLQQILDAVPVELGLFDSRGCLLMSNRLLRDKHRLAMPDRPRKCDLYQPDPNQRDGESNDTQRSVSPSGEFYLLKETPIASYRGETGCELVAATNVTLIRRMELLIANIYEWGTTHALNLAAYEAVRSIAKLGFDRAHFYLKRPDGSMSLVATSTMKPGDLDTMPNRPIIRADDELMKQAFDARKPLVIKFADLPKYERDKTIHGEGTTWLIKCPIFVDGIETAMVCIEIDPDGPEPSPMLLASLNDLSPALGEMLAGIIRRERLRWSELLNSTRSRMVKIDDVDHLIEAILTDMSSLMNASASYVLASGHDCLANEYKIQYSDKNPEFFSPDYRARIDIGVNGRCFRTRTVILCEDYQHEPETPEYIEYVRDKQPQAFDQIRRIKSLIAMPLLRGESVFGIVIIFFHDARTFHPWLSPILQDFLKDFSIAYEAIQSRIVNKRNEQLDLFRFLFVGLNHKLVNIFSPLEHDMKLIATLLGNPDQSTKIGRTLQRSSESIRLLQVELTDIHNQAKSNEFEPKPVDLNLCIRKAYGEARLRHTKYLQYGTDYEWNHDVPDDMIVLGHPVFLPMVFSAVINNALDSIRLRRSRSDDLHGVISLTSRCDGDRVEITIEDNGDGVDFRYQEHGIDHFVSTKNNNTTGNEQHGGVGLSTAREALRICDGTIELHNRDDQRGARVIINLKLIPSTPSGVLS